MYIYILYYNKVRKEKMLTKSEEKKTFTELYYISLKKICV